MIWSVSTDAERGLTAKTLSLPGPTVTRTTTVALDALAGDVAGSVAAEPQYDLGHVARLAHPAKGRYRVERTQVLQFALAR